MILSRKTVAMVAALAWPAALPAETAIFENGGDTFLAGTVVDEAVSTSGDTFMSGRTAVARGTSQGDLHVTGFDVAVIADVAEDVYAVGATISVSGKVAEDLTAAGFTIRTEPSAEVTGNARLFANSLTIAGPVKGALMATGQDVILNAPIEGDVRIIARTLSFGPEATIGGALTYSTEDEMTVPDRVVPAARVSYEPASAMDAWDEWDDIGREMPVLPTFASVMFGFMLSLLFFLALGALMLSFMPRRLENMRVSVARAPGQTILLGIIGLSILIGMIPITAMTIVGILMVPFLVLALIVVWTLGYALGAYSVAMRIWKGLGGDPEAGTLARLAVFAAAIIFIALLNYIPFVGWVANYTLVLLGIGAMTRALFLRLMGDTGAALNIDMQPIEK